MWFARLIYSLSQWIIGTLYGDRLPTIVGGKNPLEILNFRNVVDHDVWKSRVLDQEVLMIILRCVKAFERIDARGDCAGEYPRFIQLRNVCLCDLFLRFVSIENVGSILRS